MHAQSIASSFRIIITANDDDDDDNVDNDAIHCKGECRAPNMTFVCVHCAVLYVCWFSCAVMCCCSCEYFVCTLTHVC